jgi:hypothetical protein
MSSSLESDESGSDDSALETVRFKQSLEQNVGRKARNKTESQLSLNGSGQILLEL